MSDASFQLLVDQWVHAGWAQPWGGRVGRVAAKDGAFTPAPPQPRYFGVGGNRMLAQRMAADWCVPPFFLPAVSAWSVDSGTLVAQTQLVITVLAST